MLFHQGSHGVRVGISHDKRLQPVESGLSSEERELRGGADRIVFSSFSAVCLIFHSKFNPNDTHSNSFSWKLNCSERQG